MTQENHPSSPAAASPFSAASVFACAGPAGSRGCPGPRGPQGPTGPQPPLSDAVDSDARDVAASSRAVKILHDGMRIFCTSPLTLYVRVDGDDAADGLSETTAKQTLQGALDELQRYDAGPEVTYIDMGPGAFDIGVFQFTQRRLHGHTQLIITGAGADATVLYNDASQALIRTYFVDVRFLHLTLRGDLYASEHSLLHLKHVALEAVRPTVYLLHVQRQGLLWLATSVKVRGDCAGFVRVQGGGCFCNEARVAFENTPAYSEYVVHVRGGSAYWDQEGTGTCTGIKYLLNGGTLATLNNRDPNELLPGTHAGSVRLDQGTLAAIRALLGSASPLA